MKHRRRSSVICVADKRFLVFKARDPHSGREYFFVPGGAIEHGESAADAAHRETLEETGYSVEVDASSEIISDYTFFWNGQHVYCTTHFFRARLVGDVAAEVHDADYNLGAEWLPIDKVEAAFSYSAEIKAAVLELI